MTRRAVRLAATGVVVATMTHATLAAQQPQLAPFEIEDQFGRVHRDAEYRDRVLVMIGSDREGSAFHDGWESAIREGIQEKPELANVALLSVADVRGVPFFMKGNVRGKFSRDETEWILLDWEGSLPKTYGFEPNSTNILVFASDGTLLEHVHGRELEPGLVSVILNAIARGNAPS